VAILHGNIHINFADKNSARFIYQQNVSWKRILANQMVKTDKVLWVHNEQIHSDSMSRAVNGNGGIQSGSLPIPNTLNRTIQSSTVTPQRWGVWDEVQALRGRNHAPPPAIVQRCEQHGLQATALLLSFVFSLFPSPEPPLAPGPLQGGIAPLLHIDTLPRLPEAKQANTNTTKSIVMKRGLKSDLETSQGLSVLVADPYWQEYERIRQH
jgi:hypothetical protein